MHGIAVLLTMGAWKKENMLKWSATSCARIRWEEQEHPNLAARAIDSDQYLDEEDDEEDDTKMKSK